MTVINIRADIHTTSRQQDKKRTVATPSERSRAHHQQHQPAASQPQAPSPSSCTMTVHHHYQHCSQLLKRSRAQAWPRMRCRMSGAFSSYMVRASVVGRVWGPYCPAWSARASSAASGDLRAFRVAWRPSLFRVDRARALPRVLSARRARMDGGKTRGGGGRRRVQD